MTRSALWSGTALVLMLGMPTPPPADAFDLTGHWSGKWKCKVLSDGNAASGGNSSSTASITQSGTVFGAIIDGNLTYTGIAIADARNDAKGAIGVIHCGSDDDLTTGDYTEFGNWKVTTKDAKGTLSGITVWSDGPQHVGTCKYKYKRTDTTDPAVATACP